MLFSHHFSLSLDLDSRAWITFKYKNEREIEKLLLGVVVFDTAITIVCKVFFILRYFKIFFYFLKFNFNISIIKLSKNIVFSTI